MKVTVHGHHGPGSAESQSQWQSQSVTYERGAGQLSEHRIPHRALIRGSTPEYNQEAAAVQISAVERTESISIESLKIDSSVMTAVFYYNMSDLG